MISKTLFFCVLAASIVQVQAGTKAEPEWTFLGPEGGALGPFVFNPDDESLIFAGSDNGVFRSRDGGSTWERTASGLTDPNVISLARSGAALLAGTYRRGVFSSDDQGETWAPVDLGVVNPRAYVLAVDPRDGSHVFAGTMESGLLRSLDGGQTWEPVNEGLDFLSIDGVSVSPVDSDVVFASTFDEVFVSVDGGETWSPTVYPQDAVPPLEVAVNQAGQPLVASYDGLFALRDGIWSNLLDQSPLVSGPVTNITLHPTNPDEILIDAGPQLARSRDGGETWERISVSNLFNIQVLDVRYHPRIPDRVLVGTGGGSFVSSDSGDSWREVRSGLRAGLVTRLGLDPVNPLVLYGAGVGGAYKTVNRSDWLPIRGELDGLNTTCFGQDAANPNIVFAGNQFGFYRSLDAGLHWERSVPTPARAIETHPSISGLLFAALGAGPGLHGRPNFILRSLDSGESFEEITGIVDGLPHDILVSPTDANRVWVATTNGVFYSSQMGGNWAHLNEGLDDHNVLSLAEAPNGAVVAGTQSGRVFRLDDPESPWIELSQPTEVAIQALLSSPEDADTIYAATDGEGLFVTENGGASWSPVEGLENPYLRQVRLSRDRRRLYVVGQGGVYERILEPAGDLGVTIDESVSGNAFPRGTVEFSISLGAAAPAGEPQPLYRFQQALPLGLRLVGANSDQGEIVTGPAFNSITWIGQLGTGATLQILAEVLDGAADRTLSTQGRLVRLDDPNGPESLSDDPSRPDTADATTVAVAAAPFRSAVLAVPRSLPIPDTFVGVALLNRSLTPAQVEATGVEADGSVVESAQLDGMLEHASQAALLTSDRLNIGQTALFDSPQVDLEGFFLLGDGQLERLDGVGGALKDSQLLYLPRLQLAATMTTHLFLFNPDPVNGAHANLEIRGISGQTMATAEITLAGHGSVWLALPEIFPGVSGLEGYLRVQSDRPLRGFELIAGDQTFETLAAQPPEFAQRLWAPHAFFGGGTGRTRLRLLNTGDKEVRATVRLYDDTAGLLGNPEVEVETGQLRVLDLEELFASTGAPRQGWLQVDIETVDSTVFAWPAVLAAVEYQSEDGSSATTLPLVSHTLNDPAFLQVAQSPNLTIFQGMALVRVGAPDPLSLLNNGALQAFESNGDVTSFAPLLDRTRLSGLLNESQFFGSEFHQVGGHLELYTSSPIVIYTIFGGPRFLSAVEAQGRPLLLY